MTEETHLLLLLRKNKLILFSLLITIVTALFSSGFLHPDEHYQILELLHIKLKGKIVDPTIFNWDYHLKIRSWLQPFIYSILIWPLQFLNGFQMATVIRLFNGLLGLFALRKFLKLYIPHDRERLTRILLISLCTWYVPLLLVRTNSESLSTTFFLLGFFYYEQRRKPLSMIFLSLSFLIRYQMALVICPLILIDLIKKKIDLVTLLKMTLVFTLFVSIGALIDYWGYGSWNLTPYNYFFENLVQDKASNFGTSPFYYYFTKPLLKGIPPLSILVLALALKFLWKNRFSSLTLALVCFILTHSLIPHKEVRFLNFIYILLALFCAVEMLDLSKKNRFVLPLFISFNLLIMLKTSLFPAHARIELYKEVYSKKDDIFYTPKGSAPFKFTMPFYMDRIILTEQITLGLPGPYKVLTSNFKQFKDFSKRQNCQKEYSQYPEWIENFNYFNWLKRSSFHAIWNCGL